MDSLEEAGTFIQLIDSAETSQDALHAINNAIHDGFDSLDELFELKDGTTLPEAAKELLESGCKKENIFKALEEKFAFLYYLDDEYNVSDYYIDRVTSLETGSVYPLYCEPKDVHIRECLESLKCVGYFEVDGHWFVGLTSSGMLMDKEIAYGYLLVDQCIPDNILTCYEGQEKSNFEASIVSLSDKQKQVIVEHYYD